MDFVAEYGLFLAKAGTLVFAFLALVLGTVSISLWVRSQKREHLEIKDLNERYNDMAEAISAEVLEKKQLKHYLKARKKEEKAAEKKEHVAKKIFVLNFEGDLKASALEHLREEITALLSVATPKDEVFVKIDSGGGMLQTYGLAASQLARIRACKIPLVVSVDKVAASGGYLMACVANRICAAPFSIIGSIGVLAQIPNFHEFLKKHNINFEEIMAGEFKRTLSLFGKNTSKGRKKMQEELDAAHALFKSFIEMYRPELDLKKVATGEYWLGTQALDLKLVDELITSDDYLLKAHKHRDRIFELNYCRKETMKDKLGSVISILCKSFLPSPIWERGRG